MYTQACAACHGADGKGRTQDEVGFDLPLPDFSDCSFATREPDADWYAITHVGGPARAFNRTMPSFGAALSEADIKAAISHIRGFCKNKRWPRGELNLPLALNTEKAYPEDEFLWVNNASLEGETAITSKFKYEKRIGARGQIELNLPLAWMESAGATEFGLGDVGLAYKHVLLADLERGSILSVGGEVVLPTGSVSRGLGGGTAVIEPFLLYGQILPADSFFQTQLVAEFPLRRGYDDEIVWRAALGKTFAEDEGFGRTWTPMVEVLAAKPLVDRAPVEWDIVPQFQVSLSKRQHVLFNVGGRFPISDASSRDSQLMFYLLWDWYDGGLREGWK